VLQTTNHRQRKKLSWAILSIVSLWVVCGVSFVDLKAETQIEPVFKVTNEKKIFYKNQTILTNPIKPKPKGTKQTEPTIALICDDVVTQRQIDKLKATKLPITISFLPPTFRHKNSAKIAKGVANYMVHYPLEALKRRVEEEGTLMVDDSYKTMLARTKQLKAWYPGTNITNNHTGSRFTSNEQAMDRFMRSLKKFNYIFLDSRTTGQTVAKKYAQKHGVKLLQRDTFLDNIPTRRYIRKQLKMLVAKARQNGQAIAIFHPFDISIQTIETSKDILKAVKLVYIKDML